MLETSPWAQTSETQGKGMCLLPKKKIIKAKHLLFPKMRSFLNADGKVVTERGNKKATAGTLLSTHWYIDAYPDGRLYLNKMRCKGVAEEQICSKVIQAASMGDAMELRKLLEQQKQLISEAALAGKSAEPATGDPESVPDVIPMSTVVSSRNYLGVTPLHICALDGHLDAAKVLLEFNADVNDCNCAFRLTPLHYAAISFSVSDWNFEMMNLLLDAGADTGAADKNGITPLMCCAQVGNLPGAVRMLKENPRSQLECRDSKLRTPYLWALQRAADADGLQMLLAGVLHSSLNRLLAEEDCAAPMSAVQMAREQIPKGNARKSAFAKMMIERAYGVAPRMADDVCYCTKKRELLSNWKIWMNANASWAVVMVTNFFMPLVIAPLVIIMYLYWGQTTISANLSRKNGTVHIPAFVMSHMAMSALLVLVHLQPHTGAQAIAFIVLLFVGGIIAPHNFFRAAVYDHAPSPDVLKARRAHAMRLMQQGKKPLSFCWQRLVARCPRAKYCGVLGCVVLRSDHFCVWLDNHVGAANHKQFLLWLSGQIVHHICFFILYFGQDPRPTPDYPGAPTSSVLDVAWAHAHWLFVDCFWTTLQRAWARDPLTGTFALLYTLFTIYCVAVVSSQLMLVARNETHNERQLRKKQRYINNPSRPEPKVRCRAALQNMWNFFMGSYAEDAAEDARLFYSQ